MLCRVVALCTSYALLLVCVCSLFSLNGCLVSVVLAKFVVTRRVSVHRHRQQFSGDIQSVTGWCSNKIHLHHSNGGQQLWPGSGHGLFVCLFVCILCRTFGVRTFCVSHTYCVWRRTWISGGWTATPAWAESLVSFVCVFLFSFVLLVVFGLLLSCSWLLLWLLLMLVRCAVADCDDKWCVCMYVCCVCEECVRKYVCCGG